LRLLARGGGGHLLLQQMSPHDGTAPGGGLAFEQGWMGVDQILGRKS